MQMGLVPRLVSYQLLYLVQTKENNQKTGHWTELHWTDMEGNIQEKRREEGHYTIGIKSTVSYSIDFRSTSSIIIQL